VHPIFLPHAHPARLYNSKFLGGTTSPSDSVKSPAAIEATVTTVHGPRYGRPSDSFGPPTVLFNEALAILKYDLEHLEVFVPDQLHVKHAFGLVTTAASFFETEDERKWSLQPYLDALLASCETQIVGGHGVWLEGPFAYLIFGLKNEQGLGGDPFLQSLTVYSKIIQQKAVRHPSSHQCSSVKLPHSVASSSHGPTYPSSC